MPCILEGEGFKVRGQVTDLSLGGARIMVWGDSPAVESIIRVTIRSSAHVATLRARVVCTESDEQFGLEFKGSETERKEGLTPFLEQQFRKA